MFKRLGIILTFLPIMILVTAMPVLAQEATPPGPVDFTGLLPAAMTLLLPLGLMLLISSAMPEDQAPITAINLLVTWGVAALAYFAVGFAFQFGGIAQVSPRPDLSGLYWEWYPLDQSVDVEIARLWGVIALRGYALSGEAATPGALQLFLSHLSLVGAVAMIPTGVLGTRSRRNAGCVGWLVDRHGCLSVGGQLGLGRRVVGQPGRKSGVGGTDWLTLAGVA